MYKEALQEEIISPPSLLSNLQKYGLKGEELSTEEFYYAAELAYKYVKLSKYDRTALAIAKKRNIPLLTGDSPLRQAAIQEGVHVFGTIGLLDKLFGGTKMITENTRIKTLVDKGGYPAGTIGIVVSLYKSGSACEVEIWDETGYPIDVVTYLLSEIEENV